MAKKPKETTQDFSAITPEIEKLSRLCQENTSIDQSLYDKYAVNRGLRDINGNGVLTGLTEVSEINSFRMINGKKEPIDGELFYRGYSINDIVNGFLTEDRFGFEEVTYLLIFGKMPDEKELDDFNAMLAEYRSLPTNFVRDVILKAPSNDMMNSLARSVLTLHSYDDKANDTSIDNVVRQCIQMIAIFPMLAVYSYQAYRHYFQDKSLYIHRPKAELSTAENILRMLRSTKKYTEMEAKTLDLALVLHAEHGGGNNSTFTTHVVTSSGTDTYAAFAAGISSLKGPKHGGANIKVVEMFNDIKKHITDWDDDEALEAYLEKILRGEAFDKKGLIYGMGHAIYSNSDPRALIFKDIVEKLAKEKGREKEFELYEKVERIAKKLIYGERKIYKGVCVNIDFYSGFAYSMLNLPLELYTPIFAVSRISGWSAHRLEELINAGKIIRPAYMAVSPRHEYKGMKER